MARRKQRRSARAFRNTAFISNASLCDARRMVETSSSTESPESGQRFQVPVLCLIAIGILLILAIIIVATLLARSKETRPDDPYTNKANVPSSPSTDGGHGKQTSATERGPPKSPRKLACIFRFATKDSYPEDGVCDFAVYVQLYYRPAHMLGPHQQEPRPPHELLVFFQKSKEYSGTVFLAAFSPDTQKYVPDVESAHFANYLQPLMEQSNMKGLGVIDEYYTASWFNDRRENLLQFLEALRMQLEATGNSLVFFGAKFYGIPNVKESPEYRAALNDILRGPLLFILVTYVGSNTMLTPEPTAAWSSNSFSNKDMPTLESALEFLKSLQPPPGITFFLSLTLGVLRYSGADNSENPVALGTTYRGRSTEAYKEGCVEPGFVSNVYDPNEMVTFEVSTKLRVNRCYETVRSITDKVNRVLSEAGDLYCGWALFNAELEDHSNSSQCSGSHPTFPRIRAVRRLLDENVPASRADLAMYSQDGLAT